MHRKNNGFTLLEITLSLTIFAIGIMGIMALFPHGMRSIKNTLEDLVVATASQTILRSEKDIIKQNGFFTGIKTGKYMETAYSDGIHFLDENNNEIKMFDFDYELVLKNISLDNVNTSNVNVLDFKLINVFTEETVLFETLVKEN